MASNITISPNRPASVVVTPQSTSTIVVGSSSNDGSDCIKGVSLFIDNRYQYTYDSIYVKAPAGMLKSTDKVIFARYITSKTRNRVDGETRGARGKYRGWIRPKSIIDGITSNYIYGDDYFILKFNQTLDGYDFFGIEEPINEEELVSDLVIYKKAISSSNPYVTLNILKHKLGVAIQRDGKIIVDYLPFRIAYSKDADKYVACRV